MRQFHPDVIDSAEICSDSVSSAEAAHPAGSAGPARWSVSAIESLLDSSFNDLIYRAQVVHRQHHDANMVQLSTLISVKTGGCPEDCGYCPQAARYQTSRIRTCCSWMR
jgi:biotin synthase